MRLWRVSSFASLGGRGGELFAGRWHSAGRPVVYTAEHSALALLETLARLEFDETNPPYDLLEIVAPDELDVTRYPDPTPPARLTHSSAWGDDWLACEKTALALVPSILAPHAFNILINPRHPEAGSIRIATHVQYQWDKRLRA